MSDAMRLAAFVIAQAAACSCELEGMKACNWERERKGLAQAYPEEAFQLLPRRYGLDTESAHRTLFGDNPAIACPGCRRVVHLGPSGVCRDCGPVDPPAWWDRPMTCPSCRRVVVLAAESGMCKECGQ